MQATLNIRMDEALKRRGEKVLHDRGISTSEAVRSLWAWMAQERDVPDFLSEEARAQPEKARKKAALLAFAGVAEGACSNLSDEEMAAIYRSRYE